MDPEVIEIPPPVFQTPRRRNRKQVIDVDKDGVSSDVIVLDEEVETGKKKKATWNDSHGFSSYHPKEHTKSSVSGLHGIINLDFYDDQHVNVHDFINLDDYTFVQAYLNNADIPAGVEAPVPWLTEPSLSKEKAVKGTSSIHVKPSSGSSSSFQKMVDVSSSWLQPQSVHNMKAAAFHEAGSSAQHLPFNLTSSNPLWFHKNSKSNGEPVAPETSNNNNYVNQFDPMVYPYGIGQPLWAYGTIAPVQNQVVTSNFFHSGMPALKDPLNYTPAVGSSMLGWHYAMLAELNSNFTNYTTHPSFYDPLIPFDAVHIPPEEPVDTPFGQDCIGNKESMDGDEILRKFNLFKKFDAVDDHSDHHYASKSCSLKQPSNKWVKRIQEEWKILENDLPDTIFVRVYESRMDLMRAAIVGAEGTPYHDGLFFFDVFFPNNYPNVPPNVYYHSGGLRLNPNLYNCGKVCLSLLNTWSGGKNEKWMPSMSTMLQVLVSIQALILNQKPFFNEPGYASWSGTPHGEVESHKYNESTFILSLKAMLYCVRRPPKHFQDFVVGHFYQHAHDILAACKTYMNGAEVGSLFKGGVQSIHNYGSTPHFRTAVAAQVDLLVKEFIRIGVKDCEKFCTPPKEGVPGVDKTHKNAKRRSRS